MSHLVVLHDPLEDVDERLEQLDDVGPAGAVEAGAQVELARQHCPAHAVAGQKLYLSAHNTTAHFKGDRRKMRSYICKCFRGNEIETFVKLVEEFFLRGINFSLPLQSCMASKRNIQMKFCEFL